LADRVDRVTEIISTLSVKVDLPEPGEYPSELAQAEGILARMEAAEDEENTLRGQLGVLETELGEVEAELAKIPVCSTCKRPWSEGHSHITA